ncbi:ornithine cyclodeaminase family protein [Nonomuraea sp. NPDC050786]|uniref:ornithine cyclodeaminase family protein n=1 Tax=Nonomuraea sp. NPDC050786 TaxID=3154840 RepID=UPI00340A2CA1
MLFLDGQAVRKALPVEEAIGLMAGVMRAYSSGEVTQPLRAILRPESDDGVFAAMPSHVPGSGYGIKAISLRPGNPAKGLPAHVGMVIVFDPETGYPLALMDAAELTAVRTAAVSAAATDALARPEAGDLALIGSGVQARSHLEALAAVRTLRRVRVFSPNSAAGLQKWAATWLDVPVEVMPSAAAALEGADLVCTVTSSRKPVVAGADLTPGAHVNAVGASVADARELDSEAVARCAVFVDSRQSAAAESYDLRAPMEEGLTGADHVRAELGEVLLGRHPGRTDAEEITLYKSLGMAAQDVVAGFAAARAAQESGLGIHVPFPAS